MKREYIAFVEGRPPTRAGVWRHVLQLSADERRQKVVCIAQAPPASFVGNFVGNFAEPKLRTKFATNFPTKANATRLQQATTHFEVLDELPLAGGGFVTKLRLRLETGLKHQIRVQAAEMGLPLVGDRTYNTRCSRRREPAQKPLPGPLSQTLTRNATTSTKFATKFATKLPPTATPTYVGGYETLVAFPRQALHSELLSLEHPDRPGQHMTWKAELPRDLRELETALQSGRI